MLDEVAGLTAEGLSERLYKIYYKGGGMKKCGGYKNVREGMLGREVSAFKGLRPP